MKEPLLFECRRSLSKGVEVLEASMCNIRICSSLDKKTTLEIVRKENPSGTTGNWNLIEGGFCNDGSPDEVSCAVYPNSKHYMFVC